MMLLEALQKDSNLVGKFFLVVGQGNDTCREGRWGQVLKRSGKTGTHRIQIEDPVSWSVGVKKDDHGTQA